MISRKFLSQFDYMLLGTALLLALIGVLGVYSATVNDDSSGLHLRQLIWVGLGILLCLLAVSVDYHFLTQHAFVFYGLMMAVLVGVLLFGDTINGSKSWLRIASFTFQPSELAKLSVILVVTRYLSELNENFLDRWQLLTVAVLTLVPMALITLQGDLGSALVLVPVAFGIVLVAGIRMRLILVLLLAGLCAVPVGWWGLKDYQRQRILTTLDPGRDPQGFGYQVRQSQIAIGSGGLTGKGIGNGLQSQLGFVPEIQTDFIFALLAEETGFVGASLILLLYLLLLLRLLSIAENARDRAGILILSGIASLLCFHVLVNVGMAIGVVPPIGIPLPLLSYGGSFTLTTFLALGLALNVHYRRFANF